MLKEQHKTAQERRAPIKPPVFEEFFAIAHNTMESIMRKDMERLRTQDMRELLEKTWSQKLRNFSTARSIRDAYESFIKKL